MKSPERVPYLVTQAAVPYEGLRPVPVSILLHNVRSLYNVGAFFRSADAAGCEKLYLSGITAVRPIQGSQRRRSAPKKPSPGSITRIPRRCSWASASKARK